MRLFRRIYIVLLVIPVIISIITSCSKEDGSDYKNFVSKDFVVTYKTSYINNLLDLASGTYPELSDLKPYVSKSVDIYKLIYKTEIEGKAIKASGLLCVPSEAGEYPLFSFQNGTNTMHAYAPSEYVINPPYQFVEIIASMGFMVVIPDYPGFGESDDIYHPYLIKEPTIRSILDMLYAVKEMDSDELPDVKIKDELYVMGYSQGGWATLSLHKALEQDYSGDFNLKGSVCGAGPYNLNQIFEGMSGITNYANPVYLGYIINAYSVYKQFTNPVSDILKEPYASRLPDLYNGSLSSDQINSQLTTSIPDLFTSGFLSGFPTDAKYSTIRASLADNSVTAWNTAIPLFLIHGGGDTTVNPLSTENIYEEMIRAGTSTQLCKKEIIPDLDHGDAVVPAMIKGIQFILSLQ
jgi:pimeloyl-ACP methyl ester carboxylesterase